MTQQPITVEWVRRVMVKDALDKFLSKRTYKTLTTLINSAMGYYKYHANTDQV